MSLLKRLIPLFILFLSPVAISNQLDLSNVINSSGVINGSDDIKLVKDIISKKDYSVFIDGESINIERFMSNYGDARFEKFPKVKPQSYKRTVSFQSLKNTIVLNRNGQVIMLSMKNPDLSEFLQISKFKSLESLYIYGIDFDRPLDLSQLQELKYFDLAKSKSTKIIFSKKNNLRTVSVSYSEVKKLVGLESLYGLESLELTYTNLRHLDGLDNLKNLRRINVFRIGKDFHDKISFDNHKKMEYIAALGVNISKIKQVESLKELKYLTLLEVDNMDDFELPRKLESLLVRGLNSNIFPQIENCKNLNFLMITDAKFSSVPDLKWLSKLKEVKLENNQLTDISGLGKLENLEELHLKNNNITKVSYLSGLKKLKLLDLEGNQIKSVSGFREMPSLEVVNFENNPVESVDFEMVDQFKGVTFNISETPFYESSTLKQRKRLGMYY